MWRKSPARDGPDERAWSAHTSVHPRSARADLVPYTPLPAETGPVRAPDRLSIWPVEGGRYGIDAHYHGHTGIERADGQQRASRKSAFLPRSSATPRGADSNRTHCSRRDVAGARGFSRQAVVSADPTATNHNRQAARTAASLVSWFKGSGSARRRALASGNQTIRRRIPRSRFGCGRCRACFSVAAWYDTRRSL
jgi:hypothetical protein